MCNAIIIREIQNAGSVQYLLKNITTGETRLWTPPYKLAKERYDEVLEHIANQFAEETSRETPATTPISAESVDLADMTLSQFGAYVLKRRSVRIAEATRQTWESCLKNRIYPALGDIPMRSITHRDIDDFLWNLQAEGLCHGTVLKYHSVLKMLCKEAFRCEVLDKDPMDRVERPHARKDEKAPSAPSSYTIDEIRYILDCADREPLMWRVYILLMADTGIRRGECCGLRWDHVDWERNTITIDSSVGYTPNKGVYVTSTKNSRARMLDVDPDIMCYVEELYHEMMEESEKKDVDMSPYLFPHRNDPSKPMLPCSATYFFRRFGERYGVDGMHPHRLRHSYASVAITSGADIASVSECLGHSDKAFTLRVYTQSNFESRRKANAIRRNAIHAGYK